MGREAGGRLTAKVRELIDRRRLARQIRDSYRAAWTYQQGWEDYERLVCQREHPQALTRPIPRQ